jgi:lysophospholipase L1-like esterase
MKLSRLLAMMLISALTPGIFAAPRKATRKRRPAPAVAPVSAQARQQAIEQVLGFARADSDAIVNPAALIPFYERLRQLDQTVPGLVRIVHFGDSHTAADEWTGKLRLLFQARFGDAGQGFSMPGRPFRGYRRIGQKSSMTPGWTVLGLRDPAGDGNWGLGGAAVATSRAGERLTLDTFEPNVELVYWRQPGGGRLRISAGDAMVETISTDGSEGLGTFLFPSPSPWITVETLDAAPVRILGWIAERNSGVTYEALGINGAQLSIFGRWRSPEWDDQLSRRDPALVVLAFGTNEASNRDWAYSNYFEEASRLIGRIRAAAPLASILLIGPPDRLQRVRDPKTRRISWQPFARMEAITRALQDAALREGAAFWDWRARMGGRASMRNWVTAGLAQPDHAHLSGAGYQLTGELLHRDILKEYSRFLAVRDRVFEPTHGSSSDHPQNHPIRGQNQDRARAQR